MIIHTIVTSILKVFIHQILFTMLAPSSVSLTRVTYKIYNILYLVNYSSEIGKIHSLDLNTIDNLIIKPFIVQCVQEYIKRYIKRRFHYLTAGAKG